MTEKQIKGAIMKQHASVERLIEHIRQKIAWELSCEWWLQRNVKWIRNVSSEKWREDFRIFDNTTGNLRTNIDVSIKRWMIHYLHRQSEPTASGRLKVHPYAEAPRQDRPFPPLSLYGYRLVIGWWGLREMGRASEINVLLVVPRARLSNFKPGLRGM